MGTAEEMMCVVCVSVTEGNSGDVCDLASTLWKYDLRKGDLFVLSWASVQQVRRGSISSELLMCSDNDNDKSLFFKLRPLLRHIRDTSIYKYNNN